MHSRSNPGGIPCPCPYLVNYLCIWHRRSVVGFGIDGCALLNLNSHRCYLCGVCPIRIRAAVQRALLGAAILAAVFTVLMSSQITHTPTSSSIAASHAPMVAVMELVADGPDATSDSDSVLTGHAHDIRGEGDSPASGLDSMHVLLAIVSLGLVVAALRLLWVAWAYPHPDGEKQTSAIFSAVDATMRSVSILDAACVLRV